MTHFIILCLGKKLPKFGNFLSEPTNQQINSPYFTALPLLATHGYPNGNKFEVIDLFNDNSICENLDDDAILNNNDGYWSTGGLVNSLPVLCHYQYCHVLGQSNKIELNENRYQSSSIVVDSKVSCQTIDI